MAKTRTIFVCQQCGNQQPRWLGRCPDCNAWDSFVEQTVSKTNGARPLRTAGSARPEPITAVAAEGFERLRMHGEELNRVLGGGLVPGSLVLIGGDPGIGKCLAGDQRVLDPDSGAFIPITEWATQPRPVLSLNEATSRLELHQVSTFHDNGVQPVVEVETRLGRRLRCTTTHPLLTPDGWRSVDEIQIGTPIAAPRSLPYFGTEQMPEAEVKLLAYMLSDGSAHHSISVTTTLPEVEDDLRSVAAYFGVTLRTYAKAGNRAKACFFQAPRGERAAQRRKVAAALLNVHSRTAMSWSGWARAASVSPAMLYVWRRGECVPSLQELQRLADAADVPLAELAPEAAHQAGMKTTVAKLLETHNLRYKHADTKTVPQVVFRLPRQQLALFLQTLFTCDGSVYVTKNGVPGLSYCTISRQLAEDVQHLLLRFGFVTKLRTKGMRVNDAPYVAYELQMLGVAEVRRFLKDIGIRGRTEAKQRISELTVPTLRSTHFDVVPTGAAFWSQLRTVSAGAGFREISARAGVTVRNRRHERPLCRATVAAIADAYPTPFFQGLAYGDVYWDEIVSIKPCGEERVYDLTVPAAANFVSNDLIVHNSSLLLQVVGHFAQSGGTALYVSAEESAQQLRMRAERLGLLDEHLLVLSETNLDAAIEAMTELRPALAVVDSIQTVFSDDVQSAAGSVSQVREGAMRLLRVAKETNTPIFLVGHVTKEGTIAGPRVLEHIVDVVLYLEGDRFHQYRILRGNKNRFGSTDEVGVFEMTQLGLREVTNPSEVFLAERSTATPGSTVAVTMEGTRPILVEVQALTSHTQNPQPRRTANGFDPNRLTMLVAVLSKRVGIPLFDQDIYVNIVGGLRIGEPAADLAVATAIASSFRNRRVDPNLALVGEIGLSGELRSVSQIERRLGEAAKLGFARALYPSPTRQPAVEGVQLEGVRSLDQAIRQALVDEER